MLDRIRTFLATPAGRIVSLVIVALAIVLLWISASSNLTSDAASLSTHRVYICAETGKPFDYTLKPGDTSVVTSPHSGKKTGYLAETCYWTADGKVGTEPTHVLLNQHKGVNSPTFCPTCGRLVVAQNPPAIPGDTPPPTETEYKKRRPQE